MPVTGVTDGYGPVLGQPARDYTAVDKMDFMTLLVAQIKNQDPLSPMSNAEFTDLIVAQRAFQANSRVITTADQVLQELVNLVG